MNKNTKKTDKVTCAILAAFVMMCSTHFACRYDISAVVDELFQKVSAGEMLSDAMTPAPLAVAPVVVPVVDASEQQVIIHKAILRNPFMVPAAAKPATAFIPARNLGMSGTSSKGSSKPSHIAPQLKGIVTNGTTSRAIIEFAGTSSAYSVGQSVAGYTVDDIGAKTVSLSGSTGDLELKIGGSHR